MPSYANSVSNPNYFSVNFKKIKVDVRPYFPYTMSFCLLTFEQLTYPVDNLGVGGGEKDNIDFQAHTQTTFTFPFTLTYKESDDPNRVVLSDLLNKCGVTGAKQNLNIKYKITVRPCPIFQVKSRF